MEPHEERPHLPGPSLWPVGFAVGIACVLVGLIVSWPVAAVGAAISLIFGFLWIRDVTGDMKGEPRAGEPSPEPPAEPVLLAEADDDAPAAYPRNKFLELSTLGLGAVITGIVTVPILGFAVLPPFVNQELDARRPRPARELPGGQVDGDDVPVEPARG